MKSIHLDNLSNRTRQYARNIQLEELLSELSGLLGPVDERVSAQFERPKWPPLFLVGSPRSGTTFVMQLLNATGQFAVPTNLLSRFYYAPYVGAKIQQVLTDKNFDYNNEMGDFASSGEFNSSLGKTTSALAPNEFTYFWRRFIPNYDPQYHRRRKRRSMGVVLLQALPRSRRFSKNPLRQRPLLFNTTCRNFMSCSKTAFLSRSGEIHCM